MNDFDCVIEIQKLKPNTSVYVVKDENLQQLYVNGALVSSIPVLKNTVNSPFFAYYYELLVEEVAKKNKVKTEQVEVIVQDDLYWELQIDNKTIFKRRDSKNLSPIREMILTLRHYLHSIATTTVNSNTSESEKKEDEICFIYNKCLDIDDQKHFIEVVHIDMKVLKLTKCLAIKFVSSNRCQAWQFENYEIIHTSLQEDKIYTNHLDKKKYQFKDGKLIFFQQFDPKQSYVVYNKVEDFSLKQNTVCNQFITLNDATFRYYENNVCLSSYVFPNNFMIEQMSSLIYIALNGRLINVKDLRYLVSERNDGLFVNYPNLFDAVVDSKGKVRTQYGEVNLKSLVPETIKVIDIYDNSEYELEFNIKLCLKKDCEPKYHLLQKKLKREEILTYFKEHLNSQNKVQYLIFEDGTSASIHFDLVQRKTGFVFFDELSKTEMRVHENMEGKFFITPTRYLMCEKGFNIEKKNIRNTLTMNQVDFCITQNGVAYWNEHNYKDIVSRMLKVGFEFEDYNTKLHYVVHNIFGSSDNKVVVKYDTKAETFYSSNFVGSEANCSCYKNGQVVELSGKFYFLKDSKIVSWYKLPINTKFVDAITKMSFKVTEIGVCALMSVLDTGENKVETKESESEHKLQMFEKKLNNIEKKLDLLLSKFT